MKSAWFALSIITQAAIFDCSGAFADENDYEACLQRTNCTQWRPAPIWHACEPACRPYYDIKHDDDDEDRAGKVATPSPTIKPIRPPIIEPIQPPDPRRSNSAVSTITDAQKRWLQSVAPKTSCFSSDVPDNLKAELSNVKVDGEGCWVVESFIVYRNNFNDLFQLASMTTEFLGCHGGGALKVFNGARFPAYVGLAGSPLTTRVGPQTSSIMLGGGGYYSHDAACDDKQEITVAYWKANKG